MKEIGGYFELEKMTGQEYHEDMVKLNLGRTGLVYLLKTVGTKVLWVPYFLCDSVTECCKKAGYELKYYHIDENFLPIMEEKLPYGEFIYIVNYYGLLDEMQMLMLREKYTRVIIDNTHAFYQKPTPFAPALYSLRKFFGLSDGAYIYLGGYREKIPLDMLEVDESRDRMKHILGRFEGTASEYYQDMLDNAHSLEDEMVKRMSPLTENLLRGINYDRAKKKREENYARLQELLGDSNGLQVKMPQGPFAYPYYHKNGLALRKKMAEHKVYVPVYWTNVVKTMPEDSLEFDYAANILPLPCDQRYSPEDMDIVAEVLKLCLEELK